MPGAFGAGLADVKGFLELIVFADPAFLFVDGLHHIFADAIDEAFGINREGEVGTMQEPITHGGGIEQAIEVSFPFVGAQHGSVAPEIGVAFEEQGEGGQLIGGVARPAGAGVTGDDCGALIEHEFEAGGVGEVFVNHWGAVLVAGVNHDDDLECSTALIKLRVPRISDIDALGGWVNLEEPGPLAVDAFQFVEGVLPCRVDAGTGYHGVFVLLSDFDHVIVGDVEAGCFPVRFTFGIVDGILAEDGDFGEAGLLDMLSQHSHIAFVEGFAFAAKAQSEGQGLELRPVLDSVAHAAAGA